MSLVNVNVRYNINRFCFYAEYKLANVRLYNGHVSNHFLTLRANICRGTLLRILLINEFRLWVNAYKYIVCNHTSWVKLDNFCECGNRVLSCQLLSTNQMPFILMHVHLLFFFGAAFELGRHEWFALRRLITNSRSSAFTGSFLKLFS